MTSNSPDRDFMKKHLLVALLGTAMILPIAAQAEGAYIGASVGRAESELNTEGFSLKDSDTGFKLTAGYDFTKNFGVEIGYADLGKPSLLGGIEGGPFAEPRSYYLAATATYPLDDKFSVFAKAGVTNNRTKVGANGIESEKFTHTAAILGFGAAYNFTKNIAGVVEYEHFGKTLDEQDGNLKSDLISIGLRYKF
jgi:OOP family OmpA-OmpF porin